MKIESLTDEQRAQFQPWVEKWVAIGLSTEPADFDKAESAVRKCYDLIGADQPKLILWVGSPYAAHLAGPLGIYLLSILDFCQNTGSDRVRAQVGNRIKAQVLDKIEDQVWNRIGSQIRGQVWDQTVVHIKERISGQIGAHVKDHVRDKINAQVREQVEDQIWDRVWEQVGAHVRDQVCDQVRNRVGAEVGAQINAQTGVPINVDHLKVAAEKGRFNYGLSAQWCSLTAAATFFRDICGLDDPNTLKLLSLNEAIVSSCGWTWWQKDVCVISDRPESIHRDQEGRLHNASGPAMKYRDGWSIYAYHGVRVPEFVITHPESIAIDNIKDQSNAEIRRVMIERYGYERYIADANMTLVDNCDETHPLKGLRTAKLFNDGDITILDMLNSTPEPDGSVRRYIVPIDPNAYDGRAAKECLAAMASTWRKRSDPESLYFPTPEDYAPMLET